MLRIYHISDLHFSKKESDNDGARILLHRIARVFNAQSGCGDYLLVTGDITDTGSRVEYFLALEALMPFRGRIFVVPGDHDYGGLLGSNFDEIKAKRFDTPFAEALGVDHAFFDKFNVIENGYAPYTRELDDGSGTKVLLIGLNSCRNEGILDFAQGGIGRQQLFNLDRILSDHTLRDVPKILFLHHIPIKHARFPNVMTLTDWEALMRTIDDRVEVIAFGHQGYEEDNGAWLKASRNMYAAERASAKGKRFLLDANSSVYEQSCYLVTFDRDTVSAEIMVMGPPLAESDEPLFVRESAF